MYNEDNNSCFSLGLLAFNELKYSVAAGTPRILYKLWLKIFTWRCSFCHADAGGQMITSPRFLDETCH